MNSVDSLLKNPFSSRPREEQLEIKVLGRPTPRLEHMIQNVKSERRIFNRKFNYDLYSKYSWLCGCELKTALFCFPCVLFGGGNLWAKTGCKDLCHLPARAKKHEASGIHIRNCLQLALLGSTTYKVKQEENALRGNIAIHNEEVKRNRYVLNIIINCIRFCGAFELALRSRDETEESSNPGIFRGLIDFSAELDETLNEHLKSAEVFLGTSKTIQNELLQCMLEVCHEKIAEEIRQANFLAVIVDETSNVSSKFQMAIVYRYIVKNKPVERFWTFLNPLHHDAETLASCIFQELQRHKINETPQKLIAQTFDGASLMAGVSKGVQAFIKNHYPDAQYVHCHAHQLNLVMIRAASINRNVRIFLANIQSLCTFFFNNPQMTSMLDEIVNKQLPKSVPTKLNFESRGITAIFDHRVALIECLKTILKSDDIQNDSILCQAAGHLQILASGKFIFWLSIFRKVTSHIDVLFEQLQKEEIDPTVTDRSLLEFEHNMSNLRTDNNIIIEQKRVSQTPPAKKTKTERSELMREAKEVCDVIKFQMKERFSFTGHLTGNSLFMLEKFPVYDCRFPEETLEIVCDSYKFLKKKKMKRELEAIYSAEGFRGLSSTVSLYHFLKESKLEEMFSEVVKLLEILITIPMTSSEPERCFSTLKRIKTFLRNSISPDGLSALAMLSVERNLIMEITDFNEKVIEKFAHQKERQMEFLFK